MSDVTRILNAIEGGDPKAADELLPLVYEELRILAAQKMSNELPGQTLQATALVHEAYIRLAEGGRDGWNSRGHFFRAAAEAMRRILVENARRKKAHKYGGYHQRVEADFSLEGISDDISLRTVLESLLQSHEKVGEFPKDHLQVGAARSFNQPLAGSQ